MIRRAAFLLLASSLTLTELSASTVARAASIFATGTNPSSCDQSLTVADSVTAQRVGQECIVTFTNTTETLWTVPAGVTKVSAIIVGGGGGGGDSYSGETGGGGGPGGFFQNSNISISGTVPINVGAAGAGGGSTTSSQGGLGGTSYIGSLKVGGGGGGNSVEYTGGTRALSGVGGSDFVSSGGSGGGRGTNPSATYENLGGYAGAYAASGVVFQGNTYTGIQGVAGGNNSDSLSGGWGGLVTPSSVRTSSISGASVEYSKVAGYVPWEDGRNTAGAKTPGSGGSTNYGYGVDPTPTGGSGAAGIIIVRYTLASAITAPTFSGVINKGYLESVTVNVNNQGKVRFYFDGKRIPACISVSTSGTSESWLDNR